MVCWSVPSLVGGTSSFSASESDLPSLSVSVAECISSPWSDSCGSFPSALGEKKCEEEKNGQMLWMLENMFGKKPVLVLEHHGACSLPNSTKAKTKRRSQSFSKPFWCRIKNFKIFTWTPKNNSSEPLIVVVQY